MMTLKNILVATDFSEASEAALVYARELAEAVGGTLHVLHVAGNIAASAVGVEGYTTDFIALQREVEDSARKRLEALVIETDRRTLSAKTIVLTSNSPAQSIVSYAKDAHIDLVIVGTHGRGGMAHLLMGSVAERVVRTAPCSVLTVRCPAFDSTSPEAGQVAANVSP
jgi:nucleotide-binding universal stress UspA family protein